MKALCVDDEPLLLAGLVRAVEASPDITSVMQFTRCSDVLEWAKDNKPDIAFLDIQLRGMTGIDLGEKLLDLYPKLPIVFCTGYREYAFDAFKIHADGYLEKPISAEAVQNEIDNIKSRINPGAADDDGLLQVQCFGNFDVFMGGRPVRFARKRSKEVLAYLVDRRGATVTAKEVCAVLFEDEGDAQKNTMIFYKLADDLMKSLAAAGAAGAVIKGKSDYAIDIHKVNCDYYKLLDGDEKAKKMYTGEYMMQYPWAETTNASLQFASV